MAHASTRARAVPRAAARTGVRRSRPAPRPGAKEPVWAAFDDERLLDVRLSDLGLTIAGSGLEPRIEQLHRELTARGLRFRPHVWLGEEWFCPDGVPGIAIPFYLAHPRLAQLERAQCLEVEGGTPSWCLAILRHEAGHAIDNAFRLRTWPGRRRTFGGSATPYPDHYAPRPYSRRFVLHLDDWYAQSHPDEDFAETFAVWLDPVSHWRERYRGWPALEKLEYLDGVMADLGRRRPLVTTRRTVDALSTLRKTLRAHYRAKRRHYGLDRPHVYDHDLRRVFTDGPGGRGRPAAEFLRRAGPEIRAQVARATGTYQYTIERVLRDIRARCRALDLRLRHDAARTRTEFAVLLATHVMDHLARGRHRIPL